jgi:hypothetical protein
LPIFPRWVNRANRYYSNVAEPASGILSAPFQLGAFNFSCKVKASVKNFSLFSKKTALGLVSVLMASSMLAAQCGSTAAPQTIDEKVVETVVVAKEGQKVTEPVAVEGEKVVEKETVAEVGALPPQETLVIAFGHEDVLTLDPGLVQDTSGVQVGVELFTGLIRLHEETGEVQPGMATDWEVSDDGLVYTFRLRDDVPWVRFNNVTGEVEQVLRGQSAHRQLPGLSVWRPPFSGPEHRRQLRLRQLVHRKRGRGERRERRG